MNNNLINLIASFKKTGQSDDVIKQTLWQMGMIPNMIESHLEYYNKNSASVNKNIHIAENKEMKLTLEKLHTNSKKTISALEDMKSDNSLGFSASSAQRIIENCLAQLQITKDDEMVMEEKLKMGYKIDDTLVNPVLKYTIAESMFTQLSQYEWLMPVYDLRNMLAESFVADKWSYVTSKFARSIVSKTSNRAYDSLYESLVNVLIDEDNVRLALKHVLLENAWESEAKTILGNIVAEEKFEQGEVDERIYENANCSFHKNISPLLIDGENRIFNLNGKNYIFDGKTLTEANVTDRCYLNVLEGLSVMKYEADKDRLVYYGKNDMVLEYNCKEDTLKLTGIEDLGEKSILDIYETLKRCGIFDRETIGLCETLVKFYESKELLTEIDTVTTIKNDKFPGVFVSVINVQEGIYVNKVNTPFNYNELILCESAVKACEEIKDFMKYDATKILEQQLKDEGERNTILESERNELKDTITFLNEKRSELIQALQETDNNKELQDALQLIESEIHKFEKKLQEHYTKK